MCIRDSSQGVEHAFGNHPGASVGTVQADPHVLVGTGCQGNKVTRIAVPACRMVHGTPNLFPDRKRDFTWDAIDAGFYLQEDVYKRQVMDSLIMENLNWQEKIYFLIIVKKQELKFWYIVYQIFLGSGASQITVSYTHLDVYKRQA